MTLFIGGDDGLRHVLVDPIVGTPQGIKPILAIWAGDANGQKKLVFTRLVKPVLTATPTNATVIDLTWTAASVLPGVIYTLFRDGVQIYSGGNLSYSDTGRQPETTYNYRLDVWAMGELVYQVTATATTPAAVAPVLTLTSPLFDRVVATWTEAAPGFTYKLFRTGTANPIYSGPLLTFTDTGRTHSTTYEYVVRAFNSAGVEIVASLPKSITTSNVVPSVVTVSSPRWDQMTVSWTQPVAGLSYKVYRSGKSTPIYDGTGSTVTDQLLLPSTAYTYTVKTFQAGVELVTSAAVAGTTAARTVPTITLTSGSYDCMSIRWTDANQGSIDWYELWRSAPGVEGWTLLESEPASDKARDECGLAENRTYLYLVRSFRGGAPAAGGVQIGGDATAQRTTRVRSTGTGYSNVTWENFTGWTGSTQRYLTGPNIAVAVGGTFTNMVMLVYSHTVNGVLQNFRGEPKINGVPGPQQVYKVGRTHTNWPFSLGFAPGTFTTGITVGGTNWGSADWSPYVGAPWNFYVHTHAIDYWYYPALTADDEGYEDQRAVPWWNDTLEGRATHTETWNDNDGTFTRARVTDKATDEVLVDWTAPDA